MCAAILAGLLSVRWVRRDVFGGPVVFLVPAMLAGPGTVWLLAGYWRHLRYRPVQAAALLSNVGCVAAAAFGFALIEAVRLGLSE